MKKSIYTAPMLEFIGIQAKEDILLGSFEQPDDNHQEDYGVIFPY